MPVTVSELSTTRPLSVGVLHRHGIDYCCGGRRPLSEACSAAGVDVASLLAEVEALELNTQLAAVRWDQRPLAEVVEHLVSRYHDPLRDDLVTLEALAAKVHRTHGEKDSRLAIIRDLVVDLRTELVPHLAKEEQILFPWILRANAPAPHGPIEAMLREHDHAGAVLREIERLTDRYSVPDRACGSWTALWNTLARVDRELREHIALENNVLFPRALER